MSDPGEDYFKNNFNTKLTPKEEAKMREWAKTARNGKPLDPDAESSDYDIRGAWKKNLKASGNDHFNDEFKKPNHPTFSDQSIYHGTQDENGRTFVGGSWGNKGNRDTFTPSRTMLNNTHDPEILKRYIKEREPNVDLILPQ